MAISTKKILLDKNLHTMIKKGKALNPVYFNGFRAFSLAGAEGLEPSARGFGDRCSTN